MELWPELKLGWLNGWVLLAIEFAIQGFLLLVFPKDVTSRLFDRSGWSEKQKTFTVLGKLFSLLCLVLIVLTPLKFNTALFWVGVILFGTGILGLVVSMINFIDTPMDRPVTRGAYKISRHPQIVSLFFIFMGICLAIGSWSSLIALLLSKVLQHYGILAEEEVCLAQYGESYREYLEVVPRYFVFF